MSDHDLCRFGPEETAGDSPLGQRLLALNNANARELSWLEPDRFTHLVNEAFLALATENGDAMLLAFDQDADYDSPNFLWFRGRYPRYVYLDRIVVAQAARRRGLARQLHQALFEHASKAGHERIVGEINSDPPNPGSDALHAALGFVEVGRAAIHGGLKTVKYISRDLGRTAA
jgi:predicted GNAT superfamily acetyltransferase